MFETSSNLVIDGYKAVHHRMYIDGTQFITVNWTPRYTHRKNHTEATLFGLQYFIKNYLIDHWNRNFFQKDINLITSEWKLLMKHYAQDPDASIDHLINLHKLQHLPIKIYALPEGTSTPYGVPHVVIRNTHEHGYWIPNFLETLMSCILWKPSTSANTARMYRKILTKYAREAGEKDTSYIDYQAHDFSMRGMSGVEDAILSGMAHLLSFSGTDSIPAIFAAMKYYNATIDVGSTVPATEHSVMSIGMKDGELNTLRRLIKETYPNGPISIVSDTWDLWRVCTEYVPLLKEDILSRDGIVVLRPDSGVPENILCGDPVMKNVPHSYNTQYHPAYYGVLRLLAEAMGTSPNPTGTLPLINKMAAIYGDSITPDRADTILNRTINDLKLSPKNVVLGVGSYTYEYVTRDTDGFAMKATEGVVNGEARAIWKDPVTDKGGKKSHVGIPAVYLQDGQYVCVQNAKLEDLDNCAFVKVFEDGNLLREYDMCEIRDRIRTGI